MKFMLMMHAPRGTGEYQVNAWSPDDFKAHIAFMQKLNRDLTSAGELVGAEGLASPGDAKVVRAGKNGQPAVSDGPFAVRHPPPAPALRIVLGIEQFGKRVPEAGAGRGEDMREIGQGGDAALTRGGVADV